MHSKTCTCTKCGLIQFHVPTLGSELLNLDHEQKCDYCNLYADNSHLYQIDYERGEEKLKSIVETYKGKSDYDCVVLFTGGKDSTFTLQKLVREYGCKVLAVTWDNGFFSKEVKKNIENVTRSLNVEHKYVKISDESLVDLYRNRLSNFGRFCSCANLAVMFSAPEILRSKAPLVFISVSYGQAFSAIETVLPIRTNKEQSKIILESFIGTVQTPMPIRANLDAALINGIMLDLLSGELKEETIREFAPYFIALNRLRTEDLGQHFIFPSLFLNWDPETIVAKIQECGWERPQHANGNTHTSCIVEEMKGYLAFKQKIVNYDVLELSMYHRTGLIDSEEFHSEFQSIGFSEQEPQILGNFLSFLDMDKETFDSLISRNLARRTEVPLINPKALSLFEVSMPGTEVYSRMKKALTSQILV